MDKVISRTISEIDKVKNENLELNDKLNRARAESERLKAENKDLSESIKRLKNMAKTAALGREKYKQTLQEIRDIASFHTSKDDSEDVQSDMQDILTKINEVIGAEE